MNSQYGKRQILEDITNKDSSIVSQHKKARTNETSHMMPILSDPVSIPIPSSMYLQNLHPGFAMFKSDSKTDKITKHSRPRERIMHAQKLTLIFNVEC